MEISTAIESFSSLAQETRLQAFRLLVEAGNTGMPAGKLSAALEIPNNTLSFHLSHLTSAGLVKARKEGRSIIYSANFAAVQELIGFLVRDCCSKEFASIREGSGSGRSIIELMECCPSDLNHEPEHGG